MLFLPVRTGAVLAALALIVLGTVPASAQFGGRGNRGNRGNRRTRPPKVPTLPPVVPGDEEEFVNSAPTLGANGLLYVGSWNHEVQALDQKTGALRWKFKTGDIINTSPVVGPDGTVYATSRDKNVYALDGEKGTKKWQFATGGPLNTQPAVSPQGLVYVGTFDKKVIALDAKTGAKKWERATQIAASTPVVGRNNLVYVAANKLYALDAATGAVKWSLDVGVLPNQTPTVDYYGTVYVGTSDALVYALDGEKGDTLWKFPTGHSLDYPLVLGSDGVLYASADRLFAIRASTGKERWAVSGAGGAWSAPAVGENGVLYVGYNDANIYALDTASGRTKWQFATDDGLLCFPTLGSDGVVYFQAEGDSKIYALNRGTGLVRWVAAQDPLPSSVKPVISEAPTGAAGGRNP